MGSNATWEGLAAARELGQSVKSCLGPAGTLALIPGGASGGPMTVTGSGSAVMHVMLSRAPNVSHPACRLVAASADELSKSTGCGGSMLAVMVGGAVEAIATHTEDGRHGRALQRVRVALAQKARSIMSDVLMPYAEDLCMQPDEGEIRLAASAVAVTAMSGKISKSAQDACVRVLVDWLISSCPGIHRGEKYMLPSFLPLHKEVSADPTKSYVTRGVLFPASSSSGIPPPSGRTRICVLTCPIPPDPHSICQALSTIGVQIIICTECVPAPASHALSEAGLCAVVAASTADARNVCRTLKIERIRSARDVLDACARARVTSLVGCCTARIRGQLVLRLVPESNTEGDAKAQTSVVDSRICDKRDAKPYICVRDRGKRDAKAHTIMLRAPSDALWSLHAECLRTAYTVLRVWYDHKGTDASEDLPPLLPGGGALMIGMCAKLDERFAEGGLDWDANVTHDVLFSALRSIPSSLINNASRRRTSPPSFQSSSANLLSAIQKSRNSETPIGIVPLGVHLPPWWPDDALEGQDRGEGGGIFCDPRVWGVLEPLWCTQRLMSTFLECLSQLLRLGDILPCKRLLGDMKRATRPVWDSSDESDGESEKGGSSGDEWD